MAMAGNTWLIMGSWSAESLATALRLWAEGESAGSIAQRLGGGLTRNAVIGRLHRAKAPKRLTAVNLRWEGHVYSVRNKPVRRMKPVPTPRPPRAQPKASAKSDTSFSRPWLERKAGQCAFPLSGDGADTWSCCAPTGDVSIPYCIGCSAIVFSPQQPRRLKL
jgi:GcrA cell cycle regulator